MKKKLSLSLLIVLFTFISVMTACFKDQCDRTVTYIKGEPVYLTQEEIRTPVSNDPSMVLEKPGKIYAFKNYILVNEVRKGIHVIDNSDPRNPQNVSFIRINGNMDMAVKGSILYADNYTDLVAIDISNPKNAFEQSRVKNVFPILGQEGDKLLVAYKGIQVTENVDCNWLPNDDLFLLEDSADPSFAGASNSMNSGSAMNAVAGTGTAGSMSRFTVAGNTLYTVDNQDLQVFDVTASSTPEKIKSINIDLGIETIYPYGDYLFIGANEGMYIFDKTVPEAPKKIARFEHVEACDPVVAEGDYAYVTIRSGTACFGYRNELEVVNISDIYNPTLETIYEMKKPKGLAVSENNLYVCDANVGLKVYDRKDPVELVQYDLIQEEGFYDVIALPDKNIVLVIGKDGLSQYRPNFHELELLSTISIY